MLSLPVLASCNSFDGVKRFCTDSPWYAWLTQCKDSRCGGSSTFKLGKTEINGVFAATSLASQVASKCVSNFQMLHRM